MTTKRATKGENPLATAPQVRHNHGFTSGSPVTLCDYFLWWTIGERCSFVRRSWAETRRYELQKWVIPRLGEKYLHEIVPHDLWSIQRAISAAGRANSTVNRVIHHALQGLFSDAVAERLIPRVDKEDLFRSVRKLPERRNVRFAAYTREERDLILATLREMTPELPPGPWSALVGWSFYTGMRPCESLALRWDRDIDLRTRWCQVIEDYVKGEFQPCKTRESHRDIRVARAAVAAIAPLRPRSGDGLVFRGRRYGGERPINLGFFRAKVWKPLMAELKGLVPARAFYSCRHSFISHSLDSGKFTPALVAQHVGDRPDTILRRYYRYTRPIDADDWDSALEVSPARAASRRPK